MPKKYFFYSFTRLTIASLLLLVSALSATALPPSSSVTTNDIKREIREPEATTGYQAKKAVYGTEFMIAAANPYASHAGFTILEQGGSAVDAAIAVQLV